MPRRAGQTSSAFSNGSAGRARPPAKARCSSGWRRTTRRRSRRSSACTWKTWWAISRSRARMRRTSRGRGTASWNRRRRTRSRCFLNRRFSISASSAERGDRRRTDSSCVCRSDMWWMGSSGAANGGPHGGDAAHWCRRVGDLVGAALLPGRQDRSAASVAECVPPRRTRPLSRLRRTSAADRGGIRRGRTASVAPLMWTALSALLVVALGRVAAQEPASSIGQELAVPSHLQDGREFSLPLEQLLAHGRRLFEAIWTEEDGGGRPLTKGTGRPLTDTSRPLNGARAFNRISGPDANSCAGCHNAPYGISGGHGEFVTNVSLLGQRFDFVTFDPADRLPTRGTVDETGRPALLQTVADSRRTTGMFGAGYLEMLARQMTEELQRIRVTIKVGESKPLVAKGVSFGTLTLTKQGVWDTWKVQGLGRLSLIAGDSTHPPSLVIRPWHQASNIVSIREFTNTAFNQHHGIQSTERFGRGTDPDGDGVRNELTVADVTAVSVWQATLQVPGRVIPRDPAIERAVAIGERAFSEIGCATCHVPRLPLRSNGWIYTEPNPFNPATNLRSGETRDLKVDLSSDALPQPRLHPDSSGAVWVDAYTDFKLHDICDAGDREPLDMNQPQ